VECGAAKKANVARSLQGVSVCLFCKRISSCRSMISLLLTGIRRKSSGFGVFSEIFSKNIVIPSKEIPFFGEAPKRFWVIIAKFGFLRMTRITEYSVNIQLFG
jgi:hypothetical protein